MVARGETTKRARVRLPTDAPSAQGRLHPPFSSPNSANRKSLQWGRHEWLGRSAAVAVGALLSADQLSESPQGPGESGQQLLGECAPADLESPPLPLCFLLVLLLICRRRSSPALGRRLARAPSFGGCRAARRRDNRHACPGAPPPVGLPRRLRRAPQPPPQQRLLPLQPLPLRPQGRRRARLGFQLPQQAAARGEVPVPVAAAAGCCCWRCRRGWRRWRRGQVESGRWGGGRRLRSARGGQ